jgi:glycosyltransferase involved in cell wall biosynthesis
MRVGIDAMILSGQETGVGVWVRGLVRALSLPSFPHEVVVYHRRGAGDLPPEAPGLRHVRAGIPAAARSLRIVWEQSVLPVLLRRDGIDVLHSPAYVRPMLSGVPTVLTVHDLFALTHPEVCKRLNILHFRLAVPPSIRTAAVVHCTSEWTRAQLASRFPAAAGRARVVTPAVDDRFQPVPETGEAARVLRQWGLEDPPLLFVGNVEPKKNTGLLMEAFAAFRRRTGSPCRLLLVGGGGWRCAPLQKQVARLGLADAVVETGYVPRAQLPGIYRTALALVFPSRCEGFGLPPLEAMACGTPVICSGCTGLLESAGNAARLVAPGDVDGLADAMAEVAESADMRRGLREAGLARAEQFRWPERVPQLTQLYELAASGPERL